MFYGISKEDTVYTHIIVYEFIYSKNKYTNAFHI